ncbi:MAG: phosphoglycerate kinase [Chlamydiae bacterium]|nr:phosphoglycerate kinase [Chlamydiota bacterium]
MPKLSIKDLILKDKKVLMRVDFNVPLNEDGSIADDTRIKAAIPSIQYVLNQGGALILMSHMGKPKNKDPKLSLAPCAKRLSELLKIPVLLAPDCIGPKVEKMAQDLNPRQILMLENLRYYEAEEKPEKDPSFAEKLSKLADLYVNDAFGTAHRKHSSTATIAKYFPNKAAFGFLMEKEINFLGMAIQNPKKPFYAIIGGAKISSKIGVITNLIDKVDALFIGGGMTYTFLKAKGLTIGESIFEEDKISDAKEIMKKCLDKKVKLFLAEDIVIADQYSNEAKTKIISTKENIPDHFQGMDIGPLTIKNWSAALKQAKTVFWNGPLGVFEFPNFSKGTNEIAKTLADLTEAITIVGGGDSLAAINNLKIGNKFSHLSTGGGASLEYIEFGHLPGIDALSNK